MASVLSLFIHDDRYTAPSLVLLVGETEEGARRLAAADLRDNPHHLAIEVRVDDTLIFALDRGDPSAAPPVWDPERP